MKEKLKDEYKVVVLGDKGVGKTSLVLRYIQGYFSPNQQSTIAAFFLTKRLTFNGGRDHGKLQLWDTAGQERFKSMVPMYYKNADCAIVCFDSTDEDTFDACRNWITELRHNANNNEMILVICSTKCEGPEDGRSVALARVREYSTSVGACHFETSAKQDLGVSEMFDWIAKEMYNRRAVALKTAEHAPPSTGTPLVLTSEDSSRRAGTEGCCPV